MLSHHESGHRVLIGTRSTARATARKFSLLRVAAVSRDDIPFVLHYRHSNQNSSGTRRMLTLPLIITSRAQTLTPPPWVICVSEGASFQVAAAATASELPKK